jgi:long-subunit acyl-CoA synthetase (AMP-forming)
MRDVLAALSREFKETSQRIAASDDGHRLTASDLACRVATLARDIEFGSPVVGLYGGNGIDWMVGLLGGLLAGKVVVPIPPFFSPSQIAHLLTNAGAGEILATSSEFESAQALGLPVRLIPGRSTAAHWPSGKPTGSLLIYTSGSTGQPKGVLIGSEQLDWSAHALARATGAKPDDLYLSVLPLALLLESICAILIPVLVGARTHFEFSLSQAFASGAMPGIAAAFAARRPTMSVLVPHVLAAWIAELVATGTRAPESLRFVAVGGAPVPAPLAAKAWELGIPVYEGYGLSECCSVVAVNTPGARRTGTVGRPLPGLNVTIEQGEIVVDGPTVMTKYLGACPVLGHWRTGDLGSFDADGFLTVHGRKDNLIVTALGRNVSPEWIEAMLMGDHRIALCCVTGHGKGHLTAVIVASRTGAAWFLKATRADVLAMIAAACRDAPGYAVPQDFVLTTPAELNACNLLTPNGRFRRSLVAELASTLGRQQPDPVQKSKETTP